MTFALLKSAWRPAFAWVFVAFFAGLSTIILAMLAMGQVTFEQVSGTINTMVGAGGLVTGAYVGGRSYEKSWDKAESEYEADPEPYQPGSM